MAEDIYPEIQSYWENSTPMSFSPEQWGYDEKRRFCYELQDYMHEVFEFDKWEGKRLLEIGCGSGIDTMEFARHGAQVTATDITENAIALTDELARETGLPVKTIQASALKLPFADDSFDCVYSYGVLHHFPDIEIALAEIRRVLVPGGTVMAMLYHRDSLLHAYSIIYRHGIRDGLLAGGDLSESELTSRFSERYEGCPYTKVYSKAEALALFSGFFDDVSAEVRYNVVDTDGQRKVKLAVDDRWELGWHLIIRARGRAGP